jgi:predicted aconitase
MYYEKSEANIMRLTIEEKQMLEGEHGEGTALAMKILTGIGEALDADRMVPIQRAHVALSNQEADLWFAEKMVAAGAKCRVSPTVNPGYCLGYFKEKGMVTDADEAMMQRTFDAYQTLGARMNFSCTPYLFDNIPFFGEVSAFSESSATPFVNSVWGARSNREAAQSALCAAIAGRVPEYGLLLTENRRATVEVKVETELMDDFDYQLLGWIVPKKIGHRIPVFVGLPTTITPESLMNLGAELNTAGSTPMYHIVGVTPEAPTLDAALQGHQPELTVTITRQDLDRQMDAISQPAGPIDFVMFGCPHHTIRQVKETAGLVEGRKLKTELWVLTSSYTLEMAKRMGLAQVIEAAGGHVVDNTCIDQPCWRHLAGKIGATDSPKCAYYTKRRDMKFIIRSLKDCINAALKGDIS